MSAAELVSHLATAGVELWEEDGRLRFRAPQGALTDELRERLSADRDAVLAHLRDPFAEPLVPDPDGRHLPFPLTEVQSSYLLGRTDAFAYGGIGCHAYLEYELPGTVPPERAADAWRVLVERHDALRTVYHPDGQQVLKELPPYEIPVAGAERAEEIRGELAQRTYTPATWPLFDVRLTHSPERLLVHLSVDLLVTDFSGVQQLLGELEQLCLEPDRPLTPVPVSFRDHVLAERRLRDSARWARDRAYWLDRLDDLPPAPELPVLTEESGREVRFRRLADRLTSQESAALRQRAAARDLTVSTVLLAAYAEVIGQWSARPRFTLNLPVFAKRPVHPDIGRVVGDFTSVTLLAVEPDAGAGFARRARALGGRLFEDLDHGLYSGVEVLREAARRSDRHTLMPVVFTSTLQGTEVPATGPGRVGYGVTQTPQVWIDCQVMESGGEILLGWDVREGVLPEGLADDAFAAFAALVRELAVSDAPWDATDPVRVPRAQAARHSEVNATARPLPEGLLHERVLAAAVAHADRPAVIAPDRTLTYAELAGYARTVTARLRAAGVAPGERVAIVMDKGWEQVPAVLGVLAAGCVYVPVDTVHPPARRALVLASSGAVAVLTQTRLGEAYELPTIAVDALEPSEAVESRRVDPGEAAYIIYTSGSTGEPKGVVVSHRAALNTVADIDERFGVGADDRVLGLAQLGFDLSVYDLFGPLAHGGALVLPDPERRGDPSHWADLAARHRVTLWNSVPAQLQMLHDYLASGAGAADVAGLSALRLGLLSGDWIPVRLPDRIRALLPGLRLISLGGATEAAIWSIHHPIEQPVDPGRPSIPYGRPLANQTFHVLDDALRPRPDWVPGELCIGGSGLALGYHGDPETTARRFVTHPVTGERLYRTGDLGRWLPSGDIEFLGREDGQVKIRGHRIELAEIEAALTGHPSVGAAAVLAVGDDSLQRRLVAFAEPARVADASRTGGAAEVLARRAREAADAFEVAAPERIAEFARLLDEASLASMLDALRARGLFTHAEAAHTAEDVVAVAVPRHERVLRRWLHVLHGEGLLERDPATGRYRLHTETSSAASAWDRVAAVWSDDLGPAELLAYLRANADQLDALMDDRVAAVDLLFPEARMETADAAYRENVMSAYLNRVLAEALRTAAEERTPGRPLRVLEVGAGTGASTAGALAALDGLDVEWLFTDVSPFFLDGARERFGPDARLRYGLYDVDGDPVEQGLDLRSFDVVLCAGVLNNARDTAAALTSLRSLLVPGGLLLVTEPTREHYEILISQAFMMTGAEDLRRADGTDGADATFVTRDQWLGLFAAAGGENEICLPQQGHPLEPLGQHVFAVRFKSDRAPVDPVDVGDHLAERLPVYMLPAALHVVDDLPLTANGKVDRKALAARAAATASEQQPAAVEEVSGPADELEERLASVAALALGVAAVPRNRSLFDLGADSLVLAQLSARLIEEVPQAAEQQFDTLLRELLNRPTVADLARHLRGTDAPEAGTGEVSALVALGDEPQEGAALHVLVHEGIGTMAPYRELSARLAGHGPLIGLAVGDVQACTDIPAEEFVERLAAEHVRRLTATGADRFRLTGYCLGGQLATEVARQLTEGGAHVEQLTVVSSSPPAFVCEDELLIEHAFARVLGADPAAAGYPDDEEELGAALRAVLDATPGRVPAGAFAALCGEPRLEAVARRMRALAGTPQPERLAAIAATLGGDGDAAHLPGLYRVFRHAFAAASLHSTQPYAGDITLVQPRGRLRFLAGFGQEADELWREVCLGDLTVAEVDGDHFSCLRGGHVDQVVAAAVAEAP
ncbi:amino acid adenylation enzyme/thioester reductase family protein [Streptomyces lincolnensis]|uniref:Phenyloxazoline synthase MbtB n=1 Tax=Streptomyces lincolnensis TaxID=1915 RepID=A0A1B1M4H9_STRLN|nr:non-ribosomal peptide synthetase [Streptomyces lincolnensis]ANS63556.1 amino acid adenylation enzyme/thioester reductase family protein [Streptomyces lincolnensis]AXG52478.1 amino acid adenylation enzyme/thioester reductase family protein [Streptomyces lincolnensis]